MIHDPQRRGRTMAEFHRAVSPALFRDLEESGVLPASLDEEGARRCREEWECFALYACVRGLIAAGGFNRETAAAVDVLHEDVLERLAAEATDLDAFTRRRAQIAERYAQYGEIGQSGGSAGAATVTRRLGEAAARHMVPAASPPGLAELVGALHETLAEGAAEAVRRAE